jgi:hypothetical protein
MKPIIAILILLISFNLSAQQTTTVKVPPSKDTTIVKFTTVTTTTANTSTSYTTSTSPTVPGDTIIVPPQTGTRPAWIKEYNFEGSNPFAGLTNNQSCCTYSVTQSKTISHEGAGSFRAEVRSSDPSVSSGYRAELTGTPNDAGDMWYGWSMYFETPTSNGNWTGGYGGHVVQWHPNNGTGSASLAIWGSDGVWDICTNPSGSGSVVHQSGTLKKITANVWHDVVFHVKWGSGGMVECWIDGVLYFTKTGLNWSPTTYFKFGMNRWSMTNNWVIYYDNLRIGTNTSAQPVTYKDVAP